MNEKLKDFLNGLGALVELWAVIFNGFKQQGCDDKIALMHTKAFMETIIGSLGIKGELQ